MEATTWYKERNEKVYTEEEKAIDDILRPKEGAWKEFRKGEKMGNNDYRKRKRKTRITNESEVDKDTKIQAVMFIQ